MSETLTRAERSKRNREAWRKRNERMEAEARRHQLDRRAEKAAARERNRAAWWRQRYGVLAPGQEETADDLPDIPAESVERVQSDVWHVTGRDGLGYEVVRTWTVTTPDGQRYELPSAADAAELVRLAVETTREAGQFREGARFGGYTVEHVTKSGVTVRHESGRTTTVKPRYTADGEAFIKLHAGSRAELTVYARDTVAAA